MHRVELKEGGLVGLFIYTLKFLMHRVELKVQCSGAVSLIVVACS